MHAATLANSLRLQKVLEFLRERGQIGCTPAEIIRACPTTRPSSDVSELRHNGILIDCTYERETATGARVYRYRLVAAGTPMPPREELWV